MNPLVRVLKAPAEVGRWEVDDWNRFLPLARAARLQGRCLYLFEGAGVLDAVPDRIRDQLRGALTQTRYVQNQALREWRQVTRVLGASGIDAMPLKGVAYLLAGLPPAAWRNLSDIDLLVRKDDVDRAEQALQRAGWEQSEDFDDYDQHYYRDWMHEVPPMVHRKREFEVDLHHNLAPPVSRVRIDAGALWQASEPLDGAREQRLRLPAPTDLVLHNAIHLFMNDELRGGLRDVVDFRDLFVYFSAQQADFDRRLVERARVLGCGRALYYAVTTAARLTDLVPTGALETALLPFAPASGLRRVTSGLFDRVLAPSRPGTRAQALAERALFVRSHWIRMPPGMLARHLAHKFFKPARPVAEDNDPPG